MCRSPRTLRVYRRPLGNETQMGLEKVAGCGSSSHLDDCRANRKLPQYLESLSRRCQFADCVTFFNRCCAKPMKKIKVRSTSGTYEIWWGRGVVAQSTRAVGRLAEQGALFLISSPRVWKHLGARIERIFKGVHRATILFDDREAAKNLSTVERASRQLVRAGADRRALVVAVGGGVVGDVAGFVAASYVRGIGLVHIPTTLVAQVDSAVGGKTGVNLPEGKNLVGAFYPAKLVIADR